MKVLITGASGFIGRNLVDHLSDKFEISSPSREELNLLDETAVQKYINDNKIDILERLPEMSRLEQTMYLAGLKKIEEEF